MFDPSRSSLEVQLDADVSRSWENLPLYFLSVMWDHRGLQILLLMVLHGYFEILLDTRDFIEEESFLV